jgi:hypothetical protein
MYQKQDYGILIQWVCIMFNFFRKKEKFPTRSIDQLKNSVEILFIDNEKFNLTDDLKDKEGWKRIKHIEDLTSMSQPELQDAHILCVDIQGVGRELGLQDEGLGLIEAIHHHYPEKKIIMYSAETQGRVDAFHPAEGLVDARLKKSANRYQFEVQLERLAQEAFCLDNCAVHIQRVLLRELGVNMDIDEIKTAITKLYNKGKFDTSSICKVFNLNNVGSVASIISLLMTL